MSSLIQNKLIPTQFYETLRDQIAAILLVEIPNQGTLRNDAELTAVDKIYIERSVPFSKENLPAINVLVNEVDFGTETQISKEFNAEYYIDIYSSMSANPQGRADERTNKRVQNLAGMIDAILSHGIYVTLGAPRPTKLNKEAVLHRAVKKIQYFNPEDVKDAESITRARITLDVRGNQPKIEQDGVPFKSALIDLCLYSETGEYFYRLDDAVTD